MYAVVSYVHAADPPRTIGYEGYLLQNGAPASGSYDITFRIYDALTGGNLLWDETYASGGDGPQITVTNGFFSAQLGTYDTTLANLAFDEAYFVELVVNSTTLSPRQSVGSVAYANIAYGLEARTSDPATGKEGQVYYNTTSDVIRVYDGSSWSDVSGGSGISSIGDAVGSGTAGSVLFVDGSGNLGQDNSNLYWDDTNNRLGIGTTSPAEDLSVAGRLYVGGAGTSTVENNLHVRGNLQVGAGSVVITETNFTATNDFTISTASEANHLSLQSFGRVGIASSTPWGVLSVEHNGASEDRPVFVAADTGTSSALFIVDYLGNVGIGTSSPYAKLSVAGQVVGSHFSATTTATSTFAGGIDVASGCLAIGGTCLSSGISSIGDAVGSGTAGSVLFVDGSGNLGQNNSNFYWDDTNNRLGIGNTNPEAQLEVTGNIVLSDGADRSIFVGEPGSGNGNYLSLRGGAAGGFSGDGGNLYLDGGAPAGGGSGGSVVVGFFNPATVLGVGDTTPDAHFEVSANGGTTGSVFLASSNDDTDGDLFTVQESGNVGIGTTSPYATLSVVGPVVAEYFHATSTTAANSLLLPSVNDAATPTLAFGDGDTGFYESSDERLVVSMGGSPQWRWTTFAPAAFESLTGGGARILQSFQDNYTTPIYTFQNDTDTGLHSAGLGVNKDELSLIAGGVEFLRIVEDTEDYAFFNAGNLGVGTSSPYANLSVHANNGDTNTTLFSVASSTASATTTLFDVSNTGDVTLSSGILTLPAGSAASPSLQWGDNTGIYRQSASELRVVTEGTTRWRFGQSFFLGNTTGAAQLNNSATSSTSPVFLFNGDGDTGIGSAGADILSLIAGGVNGLNVYETGGVANIGIGTTTPDTELHLYTSGTDEPTIKIEDASRRFEFFVSSGGFGTIQNNGHIRIDSNGGSSRDLELESDGEIILDAGGNVGIGTTSPYATLSVVGPVVAEYFHATSTTAANSLLLPSVNDGATPTLAFGDGDTGIYEQSDDTLYFSVAGTGGYVVVGNNIGGNGGVGVGTLDPGVGWGGVLIADVAEATVPTFSPSASDRDTGVGSAAADTLSLIAGGINGLNIYETGGIVNVGIGTTSPYAALSVEHNAGEIGFAVGSSTATSFVVDENGNVGIGTDAPTTHLSINSGANSSSSISPGTINGSDHSRLALLGGGDGIDRGATVLIYGNEFTSGNRGGYLDFIAGNPSTALIRFQTGTGAANRLIIDSNGDVGIGADQSPDAQLAVDVDTSTDIGLIIQAAVSQNANLQEWQDSSENVLSVVDANGYFGIGTTSPYAALSVVGETVAENFTATSTTATTTLAGGLNVGNGGLVYDYSVGNVGIGGYLVLGDTSIADNPFLQRVDNDTIGFGNASGLRAQVTFGRVESAASGRYALLNEIPTATNPSIVPAGSISSDTDTGLGSAAADTLSLIAGGANGLNVYETGGIANIGVGTTSPWAQLSVAKDAAFIGLTNDGTGYYACINSTTGELATSTSACGASSERFKENIQNLSYGIDAIRDLRPVSFDWKEDFIKAGTPQIGFIAEEVEDIIPEIVAYDSKGNVMNLDYPKLTAVLVGGIKDIDERLRVFETSDEGEIEDTFLDRLAALGARITESLASFVHVVTERLTVGSSESPSGITLYDEVTGEPYCFGIRNGDPVTREGKCDQIEPVAPEMSSEPENENTSSSGTASSEPEEVQETASSTEQTSTASSTEEVIETPQEGATEDTATSTPSGSDTLPEEPIEESVETTLEEDPVSEPEPEPESTPKEPVEEEESASEKPPVEEEPVEEEPAV